MKLGFSCAAMIKPEEYPQAEQMEEDCVSGVVSASSNSRGFRNFTHNPSLGCSLKKQFSLSLLWQPSFPIVLPFPLNLLSIVHMRKEIPHVIVHYVQGNPVVGHWRVLIIHEYAVPGVKKPQMSKKIRSIVVPTRWIPRRKNQLDNLRRP